ncbi:MAG: preprotein translocase subunit YajC [bacterium]|nr:preprotein translocase subunit YajC [bacterium]
MAYAMSGAKGGGGQEPNFLFQLVPFIAVFAIIYFIMIRPQQKRQQEVRQMLQALKVGDNVMASGIYGEITKIKDDVIHLKIAENTRIRVNRSAVSARTSPESGGSDSKE